MKKTAVFFLAFALVLSLSTPAWSNRDDYATGFIGASVANESDISSSSISGIDVDLSYDIGYIFGIAAGHDFGNSRFEVEVGYISNGLDELSTSLPSGVSIGSGASTDIEGDISILTLLINGYYDFTSSGPMTPYLTAGLGLGSAEIEIEDLNEHDALTVFQVGAGIVYELSETTSIDIRYRYLATSDIQIEEGDIDIEYSAHNILLGFTKRF